MHKPHNHDARELDYSMIVTILNQSHEEPSCSSQEVPPPHDHCQASSLSPPALLIEEIESLYKEIES